MKKVTMMILIGASVLGIFSSLAIAAELPANLTKILKQNAAFDLEYYPVGFWNYATLENHGQLLDENAVEEWSKAGFNVTQGPEFDASDPEQLKHMYKILEWADQRGMRLIMRDRRVQPWLSRRDKSFAQNPEWEKNFEKNIASMINDFKGRPGIFGFHIVDEPDGEEMFDGYYKAYSMFKKAAPQWHPTLNYYPGWPDYLDNVIDKYSDIESLCFDNYSQMKKGKDGVNYHLYMLRFFREKSWKHEIPFQVTLICVGHYDYMSPTYDTLRWQFNTAVCSGASAIHWYKYYLQQPISNYRSAPFDITWQKTQTYDDLRLLHTPFHRFYGDLFNRLVSTGTSFYPDSPDPYINSRGEIQSPGPGWKPNELISKISTQTANHPLMIGEFADIQGRRYVMVVNNSMTDSVKVSLTFPGEDVKTYSADWWDGQEKEGIAYTALGVGGQNRTKDGFKVWHWLAPGQETVYRIDSKLIRNSKIQLK